MSETSGNFDYYSGYVFEQPAIPDVEQRMRKRESATDVPFEILRQPPELPRVWSEAEIAALRPPELPLPPYEK